MTDYKVELDVYNGPLDLLLFLIRREEVEIQDIPISRILEQYIATVELIKHLDATGVTADDFRQGHPRLDQASGLVS